MAAEDAARRQYNNKIVSKSYEFKDMDKSKMTHEQWLEHTDYSCVQPDHTVLPPIVRNARYFMQWAMHGGLPRLYATYQCNWGYVNVVGKKTVYCRQEQWFGVTPNCQYFSKQAVKKRLQSCMLIFFLRSTDKKLSLKCC